jgi:hypothetical protein
VHLTGVALQVLMPVPTSHSHSTFSKACLGLAVPNIAECVRVSCNLLRYPQSLSVFIYLCSTDCIFNSLLIRFFLIWSSLEQPLTVIIYLILTDFILFMDLVLIVKR